MSLVGISNLHIAAMTTEETATTAAVYGTPLAVPGLIQADIDPASVSGTLYADNGAYEAATSGLGDGKLTLELADLPQEVQALIFGHSAVKGVMTKLTSDQAPYVGVRFEAVQANGNIRYVSIPKVKFSEPQETVKTKDNSITFQTGKCEGKMVQRKNDKQYYKFADTDAEGYEAATGTAWYTTFD